MILTEKYIRNRGKKGVRGMKIGKSTFAMVMPLDVKERLRQ